MWLSVIVLLTQFIFGLSICPQKVTPLVFNEIFYDDSSKSNLEFVEIYNPTDNRIDLSGWTLVEGLQYMFPAGSYAPAKGYVTICETTGCDKVKRAFGVSETATSRFHGPYFGKLQSADELQLRDASAKTLTKVSYTTEFPWPITQGFTSIHLLSHIMKDSQPGSWRPFNPTPGAPLNISEQSTLVPPPQVAAVEHHPKEPKPNQVVTINVEAEAINCTLFHIL